MKISASGNTEIQALLAIESKGFKVSCSEDGATWKAENSINEFNAESPLKWPSLPGSRRQKAARLMDYVNRDKTTYTPIVQY